MTVLYCSILFQSFCPYKYVPVKPHSARFVFSHTHPTQLTPFLTTLLNCKSNLFTVWGINDILELASIILLLNIYLSLLFLYSFLNSNVSFFSLVFFLNWLRISVCFHTIFHLFSLLAEKLKHPQPILLVILWKLYYAYI